MNGRNQAKSINCKRIEMKSLELPNLVDAIFEGDQERPGWVIMVANAKGRDLVRVTFFPPEDGTSRNRQLI
jgi:hypothetical protein